MANQKITQFTEATSFSADTDFIPIVINTDSTPANRKITKANFEAGIASGLSSLGLNTKAGFVSSASFQDTGSGDSFATVTFATPFSSSDYGVNIQATNFGLYPSLDNFSVENKTTSGFRIISDVSISGWGILAGSSVDYIAVANGETAVTSSFTLLAATASYVEDSEKYTDTEISSAQLLDLHNTPVTIVPAQGSGVAVFINKMVTKYTFVTTAYSHFGNAILGITVNYGTGSEIAADSIDRIDTSQDYYESKNNAIDVFGTPTVIENKDVNLNTTSAITLGDGTMKVRTYYSVTPNTF